MLDVTPNEPFGIVSSSELVCPRTTVMVLTGLPLVLAPEKTWKLTEKPARLVLGPTHWLPETESQTSLNTSMEVVPVAVGVGVLVTVLVGVVLAAAFAVEVAVAVGLASAVAVGVVGPDTVVGVLVGGFPCETGVLVGVFPCETMVADGTGVAVQPVCAGLVCPTP